MESEVLLSIDEVRGEATPARDNSLWYMIAAVISVFIWMCIDVLIPNKSLFSHLQWFLPIEDANLSAYEIMQSYDQVPPLKGSVAFKRILFWNEAYGNKKFGIGHGIDVLKEAGCPVWQCETTESRDSGPVDKFDAIVFHLRSWRTDDLPAKRSPHQRYVFWSIESPAHRFVNTDLMENFFNWTMTYRIDSDLARPYGWVEPISSVPLHPAADELVRLIAETRNASVNYAAGKQKMAAWFVSNCKAPSGREKYVEALRNANISVDIYGACGNNSCPRSDSQSCRKMIEKDYKFYLSFENSLCLDYITEKFFQMIKFNIIPIVLRGNHADIMPPHSFINADDFDSVEDLANYLIQLDRNDTLYNEYFWWKPYFEVHAEIRDVQLPMCQLCAYLHDVNRPPKIYRNMSDWWDVQANCTKKSVNK